MNDILVCGSSYTSGDGLTNLNDAWPNVFETLSNNPVSNTAAHGGSIDYVYYTVIKEVSVRNYKNVIVTWPPLNRKLVVRRENNFLINCNPMFMNSLYGDKAEFVNFLKLYYKYWHNELYDLKFSLQKIISLQHFLEAQKCRYLFINTNTFDLKSWTNLSTLSSKNKSNLLSSFDSMNDDQIRSEEAEIKSYVDQFTNYYYEPINYNLTYDCISKNLLDPKTRHPSVQGHVYIANLIHDLWNKNAEHNYK